MPPTICARYSPAPMRTRSSSISPKSPACRHQPLRIGRELADRLDIGGKPGEPVGGALLAVEHARDRAALDRHAVGDRRGGRRRTRPRRRQPEERRDGFMARGHLGGGKRHDWLR
jgi:hypothetical protein